MSDDYEKGYRQFSKMVGEERRNFTRFEVCCEQGA